MAATNHVQEGGKNAALVDGDFLQGDKQQVSSRAVLTILFHPSEGTEAKIEYN